MFAFFSLSRFCNGFPSVSVIQAFVMSSYVTFFQFFHGYHNRIYKLLARSNTDWSKIISI